MNSRISEKETAFLETETDRMEALCAQPVPEKLTGKNRLAAEIEITSDGLPFSGGKRDEETDGHEEGRKCEDPPCLQVNRVCLDIAVVQEQQDGATAQAGSGAGGISDDV